MMNLGFAFVFAFACIVLPSSAEKIPVYRWFENEVAVKVETVPQLCVANGGAATMPINMKELEAVVCTMNDYAMKTKKNLKDLSTIFKARYMGGNKLKTDKGEVIESYLPLDTKCNGWKCIYVQLFFNPTANSWAFKRVRLWHLFQRDNPMICEMPN